MIWHGLIFDFESTKGYPGEGQAVRWLFGSAREVGSQDDEPRTPTRRVPLTGGATPPQLDQPLWPHARNSPGGGYRFPGTVESYLPSPYPPGRFVPQDHLAVAPITPTRPPIPVFDIPPLPGSGQQNGDMAPCMPDPEVGRRFVVNIPGAPTGGVASGVEGIGGATTTAYVCPTSTVWSMKEVRSPRGWLPG